MNTELSVFLKPRNCKSGHRYTFRVNDSLKMGESRGGYFGLNEFGTYRSYMSPLSLPLEERDTKHYPRKSPHIPLRVLQTNLRNKKSNPNKRRKMIENACESYIGNKSGSFRDLSSKLLDEQSPDYFDVAGSLIALAKGYGLEKLANAVEHEVFREDRKEGNRNIYTL